MAAEGSAARKAANTASRAPAEPPRPRPESLDELIHQRTRLAILSALATGDRLSFNDLKAILEVTDGNLSVHARKLEEAGYVKCTKRFRGRTPLTEYELTRNGRSALESYLAHMEAIIQAARPQPSRRAGSGVAPSCSSSSLGRTRMDRVLSLARSARPAP